MHPKPDQPAHSATANIHLTLTKSDCMNSTLTNHINCPHISCYTATLQPHNNPDITIGSMECQLLYKSHMDAIGPGTMWDECQAYDASHSPSSKLDKVENYLANECFETNEQTLIDQAKYLLFVEEVVVHPQFRGHGMSLLALELLIEKLEVGEKCVVLLQAAPLVSGIWTSHRREDCAALAGEKLARHWKRMGFEEWSWTDDAWLCLSTAPGHRPRIEEMLSDLRADERQP